MQAESAGLFSDPNDVTHADSILPRLNRVARNSVRSIINQGLVIPYSGGIDSSILAELVSQAENGCGPTLLSLGTRESRDVRELSRVSILPQAKFQHVLKQLEKENVEEAALNVAEIVDVSSLSHLEDCVAFYLIGEEARKFVRTEFVASANGPDELYCGYDRFRRILEENGEKSVREEIERALRAANDLRAQVSSVLNLFGLKSVEPFLSEEFVEFGLKVPVRLKLEGGNDLLRKRIWRAYGRSLGLRESVVMKEKKAMQYSMGIHKVVRELLKIGKLRYEFNLR